MESSTSTPVRHLPGGEWVIAGSGLSVLHAPRGGDPHADEEAPRCGADPGATPDQPGTQPAAAADRARQQQRQAVSPCERPDAPVEGGHPGSRDGALLCSAQFPGAPEPLAAHDLIGINSSVVRMHQGRHRHVSQGLLDLKRLYWNCHVFREGKRKGQRPYDLLGLHLPSSNWWQLLQMAPEELEQKLLTQQVGA